MTKFYQVHEIADAWRNARAQVQASVDVRITDYSRALAERYSNGTVACISLDLALHDGVWALADHHENWKYSQMLERLWDVPLVADPLSGVRDHAGQASSHFHLADAFELAAFLASAVFHGGAYARQTRSVTECFELAVPCVEALTEGELCTVLLAGTAWCSFFHDVSWDRSVIVVNGKRRRIHVMLATDTD